MTPTDLLDIEHSGLRAWPSLETVALEGWILRFGGGYTRRANSVQPLGAVSDLDKAVNKAESAYRARGLRPIFRLTSICCPSNLDGFLNDKGYAFQAPSLVQTARIGPAEVSPQVKLDLDPSESWLRVYQAANSGINSGALLAVLGRLPATRVYAGYMQSDSVQACGLGVIDDHRLWLFDVATNPESRRQGFANMVVDTLLAWGRDQGASQACLQVMADNSAAIGLYAAKGFRTALTYHYRALEG